MRLKTCNLCYSLYLAHETSCPHCTGKYVRPPFHFAVLLGLGLSACEEKPPGDVQPLYGEAIVDADGDRFDAEIDCDDQDALTYPGAAELDSVDACMRDLDDDGYGDSQPDNPNVIAGTDCDDSDPYINPSEDNCN